MLHYLFVTTMLPFNYWEKILIFVQPITEMSTIVGRWTEHAVAHRDPQEREVHPETEDRHRRRRQTIGHNLSPDEHRIWNTKVGDFFRSE